MIRDNKIQVFTGINDTPTPPSSTTGCNGSYLVDRFNRVIDSVAIATEYPTTKTNMLGGLEIYIDLVSGDDSNNGTDSTTPVKTIRKAIEITNSKIAGMPRKFLVYTPSAINLMDQLLFDLRWAKTYFYSGSYSISELGIVIEPWTFHPNGNASNLLNYNTYALERIEENGYPWFICPFDSNCLVTFKGWEFKVDAFALPVLGNQIGFFNCTFSHTSTAWESLLWVEACTNSHIFDNCTFVNTQLSRYIVFKNCNIATLAFDNNFVSPVSTMGFFEFVDTQIDNLIVSGGSNYPATIDYLYSSVVNSNITARYNRVGSPTQWEVFREWNDVRIARASEYRDNSNNRLLASRQSAIPNATSGTEINTINAILTALRNHGLINT